MVGEYRIRVVDYSGQGAEANWPLDLALVAAALARFWTCEYIDSAPSYGYQLTVWSDLLNEGAFAPGKVVS